MSREALEARILETRAVEDYAVLGDWLEQRGDPRGRLIALQVAGLEAEWKQLVAQHAEFSTPVHGVVTWRYGFWDTIRVREDDLDLAAVLAHPSARLLRWIEIDHPRGIIGYHLARLSRSNHVATRSTLGTLAKMFRLDGDVTGWDAAFPDMQRLGFGCTTLSLVDQPITRVDGAMFARVHGLTGLHLRAGYQRIDKAALLQLGPLAGSLTELSINNSDAVDDDVLDLFSTFTHLETLRIQRSRVTAAGIAKLRTLPKLRELDVGDCDGATDEMGDVIGTLPAIEEVAIDGTRMTSAGVKGIARSRTIQKIVLETEQYPDEIESVLGIELADR